jgi:hypothetical protein
MSRLSVCAAGHDVRVWRRRHFDRSKASAAVVDVSRCRRWLSRASASTRLRSVKSITKATAVAAFHETRHADQHRDLRKHSFSNGARRPVVFIVARGRDAADIPLMLADALRAASVEVVIGENGGR